MQTGGCRRRKEDCFLEHPDRLYLRALLTGLALALTLGACGAGAGHAPGASSAVSSETSAAPVPSSAPASVSAASTVVSVASQAASAAAAPPASATDSSAPSGTLAGKVICVDPGHQQKVDLTREAEAPGSDVMKIKNPGGATGVKTGVPEYELNLAVALKLRGMLQARGVTVVMTRADNGGNISNIQRAQMADDCHADLFVRLHADSTDSASVHGATMLIPGGQFIRDAALLRESRRAGGYLLDSYIAATGAKNRGFSERSDMTGFNWCTRPMVLVEMGFLSNPDEDALMQTDAYRQKMAQGLADGICRYLAAGSG